MTFPADWTRVPVSGTYIDSQGNPRTGSVSFQCPTLLDSSGSVIAADTVTISLDGTGSFTYNLPSTNSSTITPTGWQWLVTEYFPGARPPFYIAIDKAVASYNMATIATALAAPQLFQYTLVSDLASTATGKGGDLVGFIQAGTGAIARNAQDARRDFVTVEDFGAIGVGNDNAVILAAIAAATSLGKVLKFTSKSYTATGPFVIGSGIGGIEAGGATINATGTTTDCFQFNSGGYNFRRFVFPSVAGFSNGYALNFIGTSLLRGYIDAVQSCKGAVAFTATSTANNVLDVSITFNSVAACTEAAVLYSAYNASTVMQGNVVSGNFVSACGAWVKMTGATAADMNDNYHFAAAVDAGSVAGSVAIAGNGASKGGNVYDCPGFFGGFGTTPYISGINNGNSIRITGFSSIGYPDLSINGLGNFVRTSSCSGYRPAPVAASTATNSRSTFNSGNAIPACLTTLSFNVPALAAGATVDFWCYSPFTDGYSDKFHLAPHFSQPLVVQCIEDESVNSGIDGNTSANQIHIRLLAVAAVTAGTQTGTLFTFG